jgi:RNA-directed DNA polymerase
MADSPRSETVSTKRERIAQLAKQMPGTAITSLSHRVDLQWMREAYRLTRKDGAVGVDGRSASEYAEQLEANLEDLLGRTKLGTYRAPPVRRVDIPKGDGKTRPIGIPTFEDKVLQRAVVMLLEPVYEQDFYDFSYGFRPGRSAHDALQALDRGLWEMGGGWVLDVDVRNFFDTIDHEKLRDLLRQRVADGVVVRLIGKWLRAGVLDNGVVRYPEAGTPQGGVISPLLANIYLHEVLDKWWVQDVQPRLRGRAFLIRYADDFVVVFSDREDAEKVAGVLPKRFTRFGLTLHPEKTRLIRFEPPRKDGDAKPKTFDFLGFTHFWGRSRRGRWALKRKTARSRFSRALRTLNAWMRRARHLPIAIQARILGAKLLGHFNYYGLRGNSLGIDRFRYWARRLWRKWLSRRSQRRAAMTWSKFERLEKRFPLPRARLRPRAKQLRLANL